MFTGIVEEIGIVTGIKKTRTGLSITIKTNVVSKDIRLGSSIAVNGVCLSVTNMNNNLLSFDVILETIKRSNLEALKVNNEVNLERSLKLEGRLEGHFVTGHIDYKGKIQNIIKSRQETGFVVSINPEYKEFFAEKGSVTLDGVSLTVANITKDNFTVYLIPHTVESTTFKKKQKNDILNIETDILAKYISNRTRKTNLQTLLKKFDYI